MTLDSFQFQLCDIQGRLFELSVKQGYDSAEFIKAFMNSKCAAALDDIYDRLQWAGEEYILIQTSFSNGSYVLVRLSLSLLALLYRSYKQHYLFYG